MQNNFRTYNLAVSFYRLSQSHVCARHLKEQLSRAASSIVLNLAEGAGRATKADQKRFFHIALGSLRECEAILTISTTSSKEILKASDVLGAHLYKLIKSCER